MDTLLIIGGSLLSVALLGAMAWVIQTYVWNRRLNAFQKSAGLTVSSASRSLLPSLSVVSSIALTMVGGAVLAPQLLDQPIDQTGLTRHASAQRVGSATVLNALIENSWIRNFGPGVGLEDAEAGVVQASSAAASSSVNNVVGTNEQVEGVAEGDVIKTDGDYIYYAPRYLNTIQVFEVGDPGEITLAHTIDLGNFYSENLFLTDEYLVVIGYSYESVESKCDTTDVAEEIYCVESMWYSSRGSVVVIDRATYDIAYEVKTDGYFMDYRLIGDSLFLTGYNYLYNRTDLRPAFEVTTATESGEVSDDFVIDYDDIYYFSDVPVYSMTVLTGIKLGSFDITAQAYLGYVNNIYVSTEALYTTQMVYSYDEEKDIYEYYVHIVKFDLDVVNATLDYRAEVSIKGQPLNQFSIDEYNGLLRVATTETIWGLVESDVPTSSTSSDGDLTSSVGVVTQWGRTVYNRLYVLQPDDASDQFEIVGLLDEGLGKPGESIQSVRFSEDTAYVVTFLRTDPLYVIDLSDPTDPTIIGEQFETGYNTYIHPWGDDHLFGIGYQANENGSITGMKMSIYSNDASATEALQTVDFSNLNEASNAMWSYSYSEALWNHKALLISDDVGIVAFAVQAYEYGYRSADNVSQWYSSYHSYYYIFTIDVSADVIIGEPVIVEHDVSEQYYVGVDRGVYINGYVFTFSPAQVIPVNFETGAILPAIEIQ